MQGTWTVYENAQPVGICTAAEEGLYCRLDCRCRPAGTGLSDLILTCGTEQRALGILAPENGAFTLHTRVAARRLPAGEPEFSLRPRGCGSWYPLKKGGKVSCLQLLERAVFRRRNGSPGLEIRQENG